MKKLVTTFLIALPIFVHASEPAKQLNDGIFRIEANNETIHFDKKATYLEVIGTGNKVTLGDDVEFVAVVNKGTEFNSIISDPMQCSPFTITTDDKLYAASSLRSFARERSSETCPMGELKEYENVTKIGEGVFEISGNNSFHDFGIPAQMLEVRAHNSSIFIKQDFGLELIRIGFARNTNLYIDQKLKDRIIISGAESGRDSKVIYHDFSQSEPRI